MAGGTRYKEEGRERYLSESELQRLGEVLARAEREPWGSAPGIAAIRLLILTGCRSSEILQLRWDEVHFQGLWIGSQIAAVMAGPRAVLDSNRQLTPPAAAQGRSPIDS